MSRSAREYRRRRSITARDGVFPDASETSMPRYQLRRAKAHRVYEKRMDRWVPYLKPVQTL